MIPFLNCDTEGSTYIMMLYLWFELKIREISWVVLAWPRWVCCLYRWQINNTMADTHNRQVLSVSTILPSSLFKTYSNLFLPPKWHQICSWQCHLHEVTFMLLNLMLISVFIPSAAFDIVTHFCHFDLLSYRTAYSLSFLSLSWCSFSVFLAGSSCEV